MVHKMLKMGIEMPTPKFPRRTWYSISQYILLCFKYNKEIDTNIKKAILYYRRKYKISFLTYHSSYFLEGCAELVESGLFKNNDIGGSTIDYLLQFYYHSDTYDCVKYQARIYKAIAVTGYNISNVLYINLNVLRELEDYPDLPRRPRTK